MPLFGHVSIVWIYASPKGLTKFQDPQRNQIAGRRGFSCLKKKMKGFTQIQGLGRPLQPDHNPST